MTKEGGCSHSTPSLLDTALASPEGLASSDWRLCAESDFSGYFSNTYDRYGRPIDHNYHRAKQEEGENGYQAQTDKDDPPRKFCKPIIGFLYLINDGPTDVIMSQPRDERALHTHKVEGEHCIHEKKKTAKDIDHDGELNGHFRASCVVRFQVTDRFYQAKQSVSAYLYFILKYYFVNASILFS